MTASIDLVGRTVLVTGGGRGIGRGISERFLEAGADVVICGRGEPDDINASQTKSVLAGDVSRVISASSSIRGPSIANRPAVS